MGQPERFSKLTVTIQARPNHCPRCDSRWIIKKGLRKNRYRQLQLYLCRDCGRYFTPIAGVKGATYHPSLIAEALCSYNLGHSQVEVARILSRMHRPSVPARTVCDWIARYRRITTVARLRAQIAALFSPDDVVTYKVLEHCLLYRFALHRGKLALLSDAVEDGARQRVAGYLEAVAGDAFPHDLFRKEDTTEGQLRSSKLMLSLLPAMSIEKQNLANDLASMGLLLARRNRDRHEAVQRFMLLNDSSTIACEAPVYLMPRELAHYQRAGFTISIPQSHAAVTGHIDVLQLRNGYVHILDYKPDADKVMPLSQLVIYALALAARTGLPLKIFKCAWFDDKTYYEFFPLKAVYPLRA